MPLNASCMQSSYMPSGFFFCCIVRFSSAWLITIHIILLVDMLRLLYKLHSSLYTMLPSLTYCCMMGRSVAASLMFLSHQKAFTRCALHSFKYPICVLIGGNVMYASVAVQLHVCLCFIDRFSSAWLIKIKPYRFKWHCSAHQ